MHHNHAPCKICLLQHLLCVQWTYDNLSSDYNRWLSWEMRRNILWCFCRRICSNSWKMKLPCLRDTGRVLVILSLQTSVFHTVVHAILLYYDRASFKYSFTLKACLTPGLFSSAKTAQHSPNCSCTTWFRESFARELGQNCQTYLQRSGCTQEQPGCDFLLFSWWESEIFYQSL